MISFSKEKSYRILHCFLLNEGMKVLKYRSMVNNSAKVIKAHKLQRMCVKQRRTFEIYSKSLSRDSSALP